MKIPAAIAGRGFTGFSAKISALGNLDDLSGMSNSNGSTIIQSIFGMNYGNQVKTGINVIGVTGSGASMRQNGVNIFDMINALLDIRGILHKN